MESRSDRCPLGRIRDCAVIELAGRVVRHGRSGRPTGAAAFRLGLAASDERRTGCET